MKDMNMTERELIDQVQECIAGGKLGLRELQKINAKAGRDEASNACMKHRHQLGVLHSEMTESLHKFYPDFASDVQRSGER